MRFLSRLFALTRSRVGASSKVSSPKGRVARFESLERRELLALSPTSADFQTLLDDGSTEDSDDAAIWVSSLDDATNAKDGKITLREAIDYAGQTVGDKTIASTIRFKIGGTIQLSSSLQSLKILSKSLSIDASDVGGVTIQAAKNSLTLYVLGGNAASRASVSVVGATIIGGVATAATASSPSKGGAIQISSYCDVTLENCDVRNANSASVLGGAIYVGGGSLNLLDSNLSSNVCLGDASKGGALYVESGELTATRTKFADNSAASGGAVYVKSGEVEFDSCSFASNASFKGDGGAIYVNSGSVDFANVGFARNASAENGGALFVSGNATCELEDVQFVDSEAVVGGALYFSGENLILANSAFLRNEASQKGGALYVDVNSAVDAANVSFAENVAKQGGAFFNAGQAVLSIVSFESNEAETSGGAFYTQGYVEARDVRFDANAAKTSGGALYVDKDAQAWLLRVKVENSEATEGAGVYNAGDSKIVDSSLNANVASSNGGAVVNLGELHVSSSQITANKTQDEFGAGAGFLNYNGGEIIIVDSTISNNDAANGSGGALANNGDVSIVGSLISSNGAGYSGGAIYNGGAVSIQNSTLCDNEATNGGACYGSFGSTTVFEGVSLRRNVASNAGGALYCYGAASLTNSTIAENAAITAAVAPYFVPTSASGSVYVDSTTSVKDNMAISSIVPENVEENVAIAELSTSEIIDGAYLFGSFAATSGAISKNFAITNNGGVQLNFSQFESTGDSGFSYKSATSRGDALDYQTFSLAPNETVVLTITFKAQKVGSKWNKLNWTVTESTEDGGIGDDETSLSFALTALTSKSASATTKIASTDDSEESGATISFDSGGSFTVALSKEPTENVVVYLRASNGLELSTDVLLFTPTNYNVAQTVEASIDSEATLDGDLGTKFTVALEIISSDASWNVAAIPEIAFQANDYIVVRGQNAVDLNEYASSGVCRWDLDGDGNVDATTNGDPCFVPSSAFTSDKVGYYQTKSGKTTSYAFDVVKVDYPTSVSAELSYVGGAKGVVRLELTTESNLARRWRVDWGDGSPYSTLESLSTIALFAHCYEADGRYAVSVEVLDDDGKGSGVWNVVGEAEISGVSVVQTAFAQVADLLETEEIQEPLEVVAVNVAQVEVVDVFALLKDALKEETSRIYGPTKPF